MEMPKNAQSFNAYNKSKSNAKLKFFVELGMFEKGHEKHIGLIFSK